MVIRVMLAAAATMVLADERSLHAQIKRLPHASAATEETGRIRGRVFDLAQAKSLPEVRVRTIELYRFGKRTKWAEVKLDEKGRFVFDDVPAGRVRVRPVFSADETDGVVLPSLTLETTVRAGTTTDVGLFGEGRAVTGTLALPDGVTPESVRVRLILEAPPLRAMRNLRDGRPTPVAHVYRAVSTERRPLAAIADAQGRFQIEGVAEGTYRVTASITGDGKPVRLSFEGKVEQDYPAVEHGRLQVPLMPDGRSDEPLNIGTLRFSL